MSFSLTLAYLRYYSIIPIALLFLELFVISFIRIKKVETDFTDAMTTTAYLVASNAGTMNAYSVATVDLQDKEKEGDVIKFIRQSSTVTFLHNTVVLSMVFFKKEI